MDTILPVTVRPEVVRVANGKIHIRYEIGGRFVQDERCNLDQALDLDVVDLDRVSDADLSSLCGFCFKDHS